MEIKGNTEEKLLKQVKTYERNMQELTDSVNRPNLRIMGIEGEGVQAKEIHNIFKYNRKIIENLYRNIIIFLYKITENFPNIDKTMPIQVEEASRTPNRLDQNRTTPQHMIIKTINTETRERILKAAREKKQIIHKGKPIKITADFSSENIKARRA
jgi:hypothetical protein